MTDIAVRRSRVRPEASVEAARLEASLVEQELERRHVPAALPSRSGRAPRFGFPRLPSAARVFGPAIPSTVRPCCDWKVRTAPCVHAPLIPSTGCG